MLDTPLAAIEPGSQCTRIVEAMWWIVSTWFLPAATSISELWILKGLLWTEVVTLGSPNKRTQVVEHVLLALAHVGMLREYLWQDPSSFSSSLVS